MFADTFHETLSAALKEASRRKADETLEDIVTRVEKSAYGGYRVRSLPVEFVIDELSETSGMGSSIRSRYALSA